MDRKKMLATLLPAAGAAAVVVLIGILIALSDWGGSSAGKPPKKDDSSVPMNDSGMTDELPKVDAPEWKMGPMGIKIWDVKEGEGDPCPAGTNVTMHYTGWTLDGNTFDSSRTKGQAADFDLKSLIKGWQEGIPGMKAGGIRRLYIPYDLAYGNSGRPPKIPPQADLVFEVKLIKFKGK